MQRFSKFLMKNCLISYKIQQRHVNGAGRTDFNTSRNKKTYYEILGVSKAATKKEIRNAYVELSKKFHPDSSASGSSEDSKRLHEKFVEINEAYRVLSKPDIRREYDKFLDDPYQYHIKKQQEQQQQQQQQPPPYQSYQYPGDYRQYQRKQEEDFYEMMKRFYTQRGFTPPSREKIEEMRKQQGRFWMLVFSGLVIVGVLQFFWQYEIMMNREKHRRRFGEEPLSRQEMEERRRVWLEILREEEERRNRLKGRGSGGASPPTSGAPRNPDSYPPSSAPPDQRVPPDQRWPPGQRWPP